MGIGSIAGLLKGGATGAVMGQVDKMGGGGGYGGAEQAEQRRLMAEQAAYRQKLAGEAQQYRANLGDTRSKEYAQSGETRRRELAGNIADVNRGASSRGLLYSGMRQSGVTGAQAGAASGIAADREKINQATEAKAQQMEQAAIGMNLQGQAQEQQQMGDLYNRALTGRRDKNASREALFSAGGAAAGAGAAQQGGGSKGGGGGFA